ncbi:MAG: iron-containing alcohol dehydrogenase [Armatimonadota bacterium]
MHGDFDFPTRVVFGPGRVRELPELVRELGRQPLVVTDRGVMGHRAAQPVLDALSAGDVDFRVFHDVQSTADAATIETGVRRFMEGCDVLVAVGGGSALDAAKAIRLGTTHPGPLESYDCFCELPAPIRPELPPLVAIPTTAGTGSEVSGEAVVSVSGRRHTLSSPHLQPTLALCDPELTVDLSGPLTAEGGAYALTHCVEGYLAPVFHPLCDAIALDGAARARRWLPEAVRSPLNVEARSELMLAALMGGIASRKERGLTYAFSAALAAVAGTHPGAAYAVMLPHVLRSLAPAVPERLSVLAAALGAGAGSLADTLAEHFASLRLPVRLREENVTHALLGPLAEQALVEASRHRLPRAVSREEIAALLESAF